MDYSCAKYVTIKSLHKNVSRIVKIIHKSLVQVSIGGVYCLCRSKEIKIVNTYRNYNFENMAAAYPNDTYFDLRPNSAPEDYGKIFCL